MTYYEKHKDLIHERYDSKSPSSAQLKYDSKSPSSAQLRYLENKDKVKEYNQQYNADHKVERKMRSRKHMEAVYEERGKPPRIYQLKATTRKPKQPPIEYYKPTNPGPINLITFKF